jgi:hypothetical protein
LFIKYQFSTGGWSGRHFASTDPISYGFTEEEKKSKNCQAQTSQADEGKPPQEAFAIQVLSSKLAP